MIENEHRPHVKKGGVKYTKGYTAKLVFKRLFQSTIILILITLVLSSIYVYIKQPIKTSNGYIHVKPSYQTIEHGERVFIVKGGDYNLFTPLKRAIINQEVYRARIVAGPYGQITKSKNKIKIIEAKNVVSVDIETGSGKKAKKFLEKEYIARIIDNEDEPVSGQKDFIVGKEQILGLVVDK